VFIESSHSIKNNLCTERDVDCDSKWRDSWCLSRFAL
jgi:hypothetical protein